VRPRALARGKPPVLRTACVVPQGPSLSPNLDAREDSLSVGQNGAEPGYGWLPAVIPADARSFRVFDVALASVLTDAGLKVVRTDPDVEIAPIGEIRGDADVAIAVLGRPPTAGYPILVRIVRRAGRSLRVQLGARRARRLVRRIGYPVSRTFLWDHGMTPRRARGKRAAFRSRLVERLPERGLVTGARSPDLRTLLDEIVSDASNGRVLEARPSIRAEVLIADTEHGVLRVGIGPGRRQIVGQRAAIATLEACGPPPFVAERVPRQVRAGRRGGADWSLASRLSGTRPQPPLTGPLLADCLDFLLALHSTCQSDAIGGAFLEQAESVARVCSSEQARILGKVAERLEQVLADLPRGFAHGDFFHANFLAKRGRLVGVVDWDAAGACRPPLLDFFHLHLLSRGSEVADLDWGRLVVRRLLPWARAGGDGLVRDYSRRAGLTVTSTELEALAIAYWLDFVTYQLRVHEHRLAQPRWLERSVHLVLRGVDANGAMR
jgi:hypothetical protein